MPAAGLKPKDAYTPRRIKILCGPDCSKGNGFLPANAILFCLKADNLVCCLTAAIRFL